MSHNLSVNAAGQAEMFVAGAPAWHRLGTNVQQAQKWEDAYKLAKLNWTISKHQLLNPVTKAALPLFGILRDDDHRFLGTCGDKYQLLQNSEAFTSVDAIVGTGEAHYESAGALGNGETMWCLARIDEEFSPVKGDRHIPYLMFAEFRNGRAALAKLTTVRVVCNNTLTAALQEASTPCVRLTHTGSMTDKLAEAKRVLKGVKTDIAMMNSTLKQLAEKAVTLPQFETVLNKLFPDYEKSSRMQNQAAVVAANFQANDGDRIAGTSGSAYALFNAVTRYVDHQKDGFKTGKDIDQLKVKRAESALFGAGEALKMYALQQICLAVSVKAFETVR